MQESDCRVPASHGCWHTCFQPWVNTSPGHPTYTPAHTDQARLYDSHRGSSWNACGSGAELLLPSLWPKASILSVCCLHCLHRDSTPIRELLATSTGILGALAALCCLLPSLPAPCWSCPCHTASCSLLQGCYTAARGLHVK